MWVGGGDKRIWGGERRREREKREQEDWETDHPHLGEMEGWTWNGTRNDQQLLSPYLQHGGARQELCTEGCWPVLPARAAWLLDIQGVFEHSPTSCKEGWFPGNSSIKEHYINTTSCGMLISACEQERESRESLFSRREISSPLEKNLALMVERPLC